MSPSGFRLSSRAVGFLYPTMSVPRRKPHRLNPDNPILTGQTDTHLCSATTAERFGAFLHTCVVQPFLDLQELAADAGFDVRVFSGFRGFESQLSIWNRKARGALVVLDSEAEPIALEGLSERDLVYAILRWSALPGGSRHHWGTDIDIIDENARPQGYEVDLIPEEVNPDGIFGPLHEWLDERIAEGAAHGFFRPYDQDRGGVAPERWHISHGPTAIVLEKSFTKDLLRETLTAADMDLKATVLEELDEIYERFVINTQRTPA